MPDQVGHDECVIAGLTGNLNENNLKTDIMIKVSNLSKIFRTEEIETTALNGVSFEIKEVNNLYGENAPSFLRP